MIYPGEYIPLVKPEVLASELEKQGEGTVVQPLVNMREQPEHFHIELAIPGLRREEFYISADDNILSVAVLHRECGGKKQDSFHLHEFNYGCFKRQIILPEKVDTEFVLAEYKRGVLHLYVPKTEQVAAGIHTRIVVY